MQQHSAARPPMSPILMPQVMTSAVRAAVPQPVDAVSSWLAGAHPAPDRVHRQWTEAEVALVPLGVRFAAVRISAAIMHAAIGSEERDAVADVARDVFRGPVMAGLRSLGLTYWALVPWRAGVYWPALPDTPYLGKGAHLSVPTIDRTELPGPHWIAPPRYAYDLCSLERLFDVGMRGSHILERDARTRR